MGKRCPYDAPKMGEMNLTSYTSIMTKDLPFTSKPIYIYFCQHLQPSSNTCQTTLTFNPSINRVDVKE